MPDQVVGLSSAGFRALAACPPPHGAELEYSGGSDTPRPLGEAAPFPTSSETPMPERTRFCQPGVFTLHY